MHRLLLTAIHYNYNADRDVAKSKQGTVISTVRMKKSKKGEATLEIKKEDASYGRFFIIKFIMMFKYMCFDKILLLLGCSICR